jgi:hypothetical protein
MSTVVTLKKLNCTSVSKKQIAYHSEGEYTMFLQQTGMYLQVRKALQLKDQHRHLELRENLESHFITDGSSIKPMRNYESFRMNTAIGLLEKPVSQSVD